MKNTAFIRKGSGGFPLLGAAILLLAGCGPGDAGKSAQNPGNSSQETVYTVRTTAAGIRDIQEYIEVNGDVITETSVDVYPDIAGKIVKLTVALGDTVKKNQVIAEIDPSKPGVTYALSPVKAPIDGTVTSVPGKIGATVGTSSVVAEIGQMNSIQVKTRIPEREIGRVRLGQKGLISFDAYPGEIFSARIAKLSPVVDSVTRTKEVRLSFTGPAAGKLSVGMFGKITIHTTLHPSLLVVPEEALVLQYGKPVAFVLSGEDRVESRSVATGLSVDGFIEITSGLKEGELVVSEGQSLLKDGAKVRVVSSKGDKS